MAMRNSAPALGNRVLNSETPPKSQSVIPSISTPSRRACHEWPSSCRSSDAKNNTAATIAIARCTPPERPGFCDGKTPSASDQTIKAKITIQLQLTRTSMPPKRPSLMFPFTTRGCGFPRSRSGIRLRRSVAAIVVSLFRVVRAFSPTAAAPSSFARGRPRLRRGRHRSPADNMQSNCPQDPSRLRVDSFDRGRNDANVSPELEDQVVGIGCRHRTQRG